MTRARALGGARQLRRVIRSPLPAPIATPLRAVHDRLAARWGTDLTRLLDEGGQQARALAGLGAPS
ncbi:hypothetical protein H7X46_03620 [Pseudonocardia sp. C8]|uniref:hypothetical protein n=1 Tax=Pseudonocardia sp. C8 TaxID=2762759 RepID=UPI00164313C9|nr:hypothetical protein [Pseudonocardia sp. C8]MBC3190151.1 hypothetical protein [Pseudonocardia sp. C8]